jgi:hypothetical protein
MLISLAHLQWHNMHIIFGVKRLYDLKIWTACLLPNTVKRKFVTISIVKCDVKDEKEVYNKGIFVSR